MFVLRPLTVYATDMPLAHLRTAELFVVCSLRLWVLGWRDRDAVSPDWRKGFAVAGIAGDGEAAFDELLRVVATTAVRSLDVRCKRCARLGEDEAWLLQLLSLLQRDRIAEAAAILSHWLPPSAVRLATGPAQVAAAALVASGLALPIGDAEAAPSCRSASPGQGGCGSTLIH